MERYYCFNLFDDRLETKEFFNKLAASAEKYK
jgi:hypothetical protein